MELSLEVKIRGRGTVAGLAAGSLLRSLNPVTGPLARTTVTAL